GPARASRCPRPPPPSGARRQRRIRLQGALLQAADGGSHSTRLTTSSGSCPVSPPRRARPPAAPRRRPSPHGPLRPEHQDRHAGVGHRMREDRRRQASGPLVEAGQEHSDDENGQEANDIEMEIGRASCREREETAGATNTVMKENGWKRTSEALVYGRRTSM